MKDETCQGQTIDFFFILHPSALIHLFQGNAKVIAQ